ncbi:LysM peptidoglycan-binding domain-containing protein [uncultured Roseibium sp.]|uniref:LysM peptidoglycan-binding domain-containing protein n=1 Tax=uncultured Roseibium sp. TaxID=1936171 RepID=UPI002622D167|nr:LysM peptidoglycan-binding domain-containing protein [uncultured Roseibium sp.]
MNKLTLIWTLIVGVPVGVAAVVTGYTYNQTGRLPFQQPAEVVSAPATQETDEQSVSSLQQSSGSDGPVETKAAEKSVDVESGTPPKGPSFDVVGVEPTGETVVAGRSDAGAIVALLANGKVVGTSIANEAGEWTIILDEPLKPGDYDVGLEVHDEKGQPVEQSTERLAVSIPEGGNEQPLVVLNTPDGPSDVLQKPATETVIAAAPQTSTSAQVTGKDSAADTGQTPSVEVETAAVETTGEDVSAKSSEASNPSAEVAVSASAAPETSSQATEEQTAAASQETAPATEDGKAQVASQRADAPSGETTAVAESGDHATPEVKAEETQTATASSQQDSQGAVTAETQSTIAGKSEKAPAETSDAASAATETPTQAAPTVTVEAVESEKDTVYVAGTGEPGSSVRVYVGDEFQGEAQVNSSGKWLVQGSKNIAEGDVEVRADLIAGDGSSVDARAAVTFEKEEDKQIVLTKVVATGSGDTGDGQGAQVKKSLPVVIIRKGDNLWRISRRLYGDGVRYTTIYKANTDQIRNPDLIYPGQVFLTPEGDLNWSDGSDDDGRNG